MIIAKVSQIINILLILLMFICLIRFILRIFENKYGIVKTADAIVIDKYTQTVILKSGLKSIKYMVVFLIDGKKVMFTVSEFTYPGYSIKEKGVLKYRGNSIIDFS